MASERELNLIRAAAEGDLEGARILVGRGARVNVHENADPGQLRVRDENGVDLTLIRWMLSLTPAERLDVLQDFVNDVLEIRELNGIEELPGNPTGPDGP